MVNDTGRVSKICAKMLPNNKFPDDSSQAKSENVDNFKVQRFRMPRFWVHRFWVQRSKTFLIYDFAGKYIFMGL